MARIIKDEVTTKEKKEITLAAFREMAKAAGYVVHTRTTSFSGLGYHEPAVFLSLYKQCRKVVFGVGTEDYWKEFDQKFPLVREWKATLRIKDGDKRIIFE